MNPNCLNVLKQKKMVDKLLHEKRRSNLFQNKYSAEIKKKHAIIQELETIQNESFNESSISFTEENEQTLHYDIPKLLTELTDVTRIVDIWKEQSFIPKSDTIYACLSVDAIYFTPDIHLDEKSIFSGLILNESDEKLISKNAFARFSKNPNELQIFLQLNSDKIIRSGFIFHVQPYNPIYDTFIAHVHPASNGKANDIILFKLDEIKKLLKNRNITILSYSFDGDNKYSVLHQKYFNSYFNTVIKNNIISFSKTLVFKVNSDFLHLIKRLPIDFLEVKFTQVFLYLIHLLIRANLNQFFQTFRMWFGMMKSTQRCMIHFHCFCLNLNTFYIFF